jgi:predicted dithiol-disulfide oxidoreductase (DUF899 family)
MANHKVASREEWLEARKALLVHEKEETRLRDRNAAERLALPWVKVDKAYGFDTPSGRKTLAELFDGRSQLVVYHFMLPPEWDAGCPGCSFLADHLDGTLPHLNHHDVTLIAVSRAPLDKIAAYKARMGWKFPWASSFESDFNYDFGVSFTPEDHRGRRDLQFRAGRRGRQRTARHERVLQGRDRPGVPHLFQLRPRRRGTDRAPT